VPCVSDTVYGRRPPPERGRLSSNESGDRRRHPGDEEALWIRSLAERRRSLTPNGSMVCFSHPLAWAPWDATSAATHGHTITRRAGHGGGRRATTPACAKGPALSSPSRPPPARRSVVGARKRVRLELRERLCRQQREKERRLRRPVPSGAAGRTRRTLSDALPWPAPGGHIKNLILTLKNPPFDGLEAIGLGRIPSIGRARPAGPPTDGRRRRRRRLLLLFGALGLS